MAGEQTVRRWLNRGPVVDAVVVAAILILGSLAGKTYDETFRGAGGKEDFVQREFAAAVALACGRGFVDIGHSLTPELDDFLALKRDTFGCATLPAQVPQAVPNQTQGLYRYLMSTVALVWKVRGVAWSALSPLFGLAFGLTLVAAYLLFRLGMGRVLAVAMTGMLSISAVHLGYLPDLRDYFKAPFMLFLLLVMIRIARDPFEWKRALAWSAAFGVVIGIGFGFRNDLLINLVPWLGVLLFCTRPKLWEALPLKAACLVLSVAVFWIVALPISAAYGRGSNSGHVALLGLMNVFDTPLGVASSVYHWGYLYSDSLVSTQINSYTYRLYGHPVAYLTADYDRAMVEFISRIARDWPADILARAYGSVLKVLQFPFEVGVYHNRIPFGIASPWAVSLYGWQIGTLELLAGSGVYLVAAALAVIAASSPGTSVTLFVFLLYFTGYPAIQFNARHFFHLEFIVWWALGFLIQQAIDWMTGKPSTAGLVLPAFPQSARRAGAFIALTAGLVAIPMVVLRAYQAPHVRSLLDEKYLAAPRTPLATVSTPQRGGYTLLAIPDLWSHRDTSQSVNAAYVVAEFSSRNCRTQQVPVTFRYNSKAPPADFSYDTTVTILPTGESTLVFFPGYYWDGWTEFSGVELATSDVGCLSGLSKIADDRLPDLLLNLMLTPHWRDAKLYQVLTAVETPDEGDGVTPVRYSFPPGQKIASDGDAAPLVSPEEKPPVVAAIVTPKGDGWSIAGRPASTYAYLIQTEPKALSAGTKLVVSGDVRAGRFSIGLLREAQFVGGMVNIVTRGRFVATVAVPESGDYSFVVADYSTPRWVDQYWPMARRLLPGGWLLPSPVDAEIGKVGWVPRVP